MIASQKVREGKLVKVEVECGESIRKIKITGDFFLHPEDVLEEIERSMLGLGKDIDAETIASRIRSITGARGAQMIGIGAESLASVIKEALR